MLKKANRIVRSKEFDRVFKLGQSFYGQNIGIKVFKNTKEEIRLGLLVGTKVSKKAPTRNKIKRQIRDIFRKEMPILSRGKDIVIVALRPILNKKYQEIQTDLKSVLKKLKLYKK